MGVIQGGPNAGFKHRILHSIISGLLDCDKVDYLGRDAIHLGVPFGSAVDYERLLRNFTFVYEGDPKTPREYLAEVAVTEKARTVAQSIWRTRHDMFTQVYWQHTVRSMKCMLAFVVRRVLDTVLKQTAEGDETPDAFWSTFYELISGHYGAVWSAVAGREEGALALTEDEVMREVSSAVRAYSGRPEGLKQDPPSKAELCRYLDPIFVPSEGPHKNTRHNPEVGIIREVCSRIFPVRPSTCARARGCVLVP